MTSDDVPGDLAELYDRYRPLLLSGVAALADMGMDVNPADGLDLVHAFFADALPRVLKRYDPSRGKFSTYLYGSFLRFVRWGIAREAKWKPVVVPLEEAMREPAPEEAPEEDQVDVIAAEEAIQRRLACALQRLPPTFQTVLEARLVERESERDIAKRMDLTRHAARQLVAEALGRAAVVMDQLEIIPVSLRPFALRLWRDEIPLMRVAKEFKLTRREGMKCHRRLVRKLISAATKLKNVPSVKERGRDD